MHFKVKIYLDGSIVAPSEVKNLTISNTNVDRLVNDVADRENVKRTSKVTKKTETVRSA